MSTGGLWNTLFGLVKAALCGICVALLVKYLQGNTVVEPQWVTELPLVITHPRYSTPLFPSTTTKMYRPVSTTEPLEDLPSSTTPVKVELSTANQPAVDDSSKGSSNCTLDFSIAVGIQLEPWTASGITQEMLDELYCIRKQVARVSIHKGRLSQQNWQLTMDHNRLRSAFWLLHRVIDRAAAQRNPIPDVEFVVNPTDKTSKFASGKQQKDSDGKRLRSAPLFCNVKCKGDTSISFPLYYHMLYGEPDGQMSYDMYQSRRKKLENMEDGVAWNAKSPKLFFSATNVRGNRGKVFKMESPHLTTLMQNVPLRTYGQYQYSLYTYGHSGWSRRLRELAYFNTTVLMEVGCQSQKRGAGQRHMGRG